jgi:hypothetical protein
MGIDAEEFAREVDRVGDGLPPARMGFGHRGSLN